LSTNSPQFPSLSAIETLPPPNQGFARSRLVRR
jgi:hypothetical protein